MTNNAGAYSIEGFPIGDYTVQMSRPGFKNTQSSVHLVATQIQALDVRVELGSTGETMVVNAAPQLLDSETLSVTNALEEEALRDLPLNATNGRDAVQLLVRSTPSAAKSGVSSSQVYSTLYLGGANSWANTAYVDDTISSVSQAAIAGVSYPYAGFTGPAYAANAPIPQAASYNNTVVLTTDQQLGASSYNAFVAEIKAQLA